MKNILLVANWDSNVGYAWWLMENFWSVIAKEFDKTGHQSVLIYPTVSTIPKIIQDSPIEVIEQNYDDRNLTGILRLIRLVRRKNIAYVYLSDKPETSLFYILLKIFGVEKIIIHDHTPGERKSIHGIKKIIKNLYKSLPLINADVFVAVTDYIRNRMIDAAGIPPLKCYVAKNGINPINRNHEFRYYAHNQFNLPLDAILIITTGRASYYKRIDFMIEAFAMVLNEKPMPNLYFIYCGNGPHLKNFQDLAKSLDVDTQIIFAGNRDDVRLLLQSCDIGIQASKGEVGYSLSILEYMSAGLATLVPDNPSVCQSITDNYNGFYFEQNNHLSLSRKIISLIENDSLRKQAGESAIKTVSEDYSLNNTNQALVSILKRYIN